MKKKQVKELGKLIQYIANTAAEMQEIRKDIEIDSKWVRESALQTWESDLTNIYNEMFSILEGVNK